MTSESPILIARQPITNLRGEVFAYELLYRGTASEHASDTAKSAQVLCEAMSSHGLRSVVGTAKVFVNFGQDLLKTEVPMILPSGQGVVEIVENVEPSPRIIAMIAKLREKGLGIALDDFMFQPNMVPFLPYSNFIKVDVQQSAHELDDLVNRLRSYQVPLIAEKVETIQEARRCADLGFQLFQGYFFARPETLRARSVASTQVAIVSLIADLQNPDLEPEALASSIGQDLGITHRILKLCNSASYHWQRPIASITDAVVLLGRDVLTQWACLFLLTRLAKHKPLELYNMAIIRARLCQALGKVQGGYNPSELYVLGLLSLLDALLDRPMDVLVQEMPLSKPLQDALCGDRSSGLGNILRQALAYESGEWNVLSELTVDDEMRLSAAFTGGAQFARTALAR